MNPLNSFDVTIHKYVIRGYDGFASPHNLVKEVYVVDMDEMNKEANDMISSGLSVLIAQTSMLGDLIKNKEIF